MLKRKSVANDIVEAYQAHFRSIADVQAAFSTRPVPDEALCALLWEYKSRGQKGYDLTERFFHMFRTHLPHFPIIGPPRAGRDILLGSIFTNYPNPKRPVDFVIYDPTEREVLAVGLARYDSDRGGAQEDDRTGGYRDCIREMLGYADDQGLRTKLIFLNDGPGLLLGSMWADYGRLEQMGQGRVLVTTLRMIPERLTADWLMA